VFKEESDKYTLTYSSKIYIGIALRLEVLKFPANVQSVGGLRNFVDILASTGVVVRM
jgi:hypothetical protein